MKHPILPGRAALVAGLLCAAAMLAGCTVLPPVEDETRFYSLTPASDGGLLGAVAPADAPTIGVRLISVASHLRKTPIAVRVGEHEVRFEADHRWAEQLGDSVVRSVAGGVQRAAGSRIHVFVAPALRTAAPGVLVELDLIACEGRRGAESSALLVVDWRVFKAREQKPAASGRFRVEKPGWNGADYDQLVALLAVAVSDLTAAVAGPAMEVAGE